MTQILQFHFKIDVFPIYSLILYIGNTSIFDSNITISLQNWCIPYIQFNTVYMEYIHFWHKSHIFTSKLMYSLYTVQYCIYGIHPFLTQISQIYFKIDVFPIYSSILYIWNTSIFDSNITDSLQNGCIPYIQSNTVYKEYIIFWLKYHSIYMKSHYKGLGAAGAGI